MEMKTEDHLKHIEMLNKSDLGEFQRMYKGFGIECKVNPQYDKERFLGYEVTMTSSVGNPDITVNTIN